VHASLIAYEALAPTRRLCSKAGIAVASKDKLPALLDTLLAAAKAGEFDELMSRMGKPFGAAKTKRAA